jgi:hypothetical protein
MEVPRHDLQERYLLAEAGILDRLDLGRDLQLQSSWRSVDLVAIPPPWRDTIHGSPETDYQGEQARI